MKFVIASQQLIHYQFCDFQAKMKKGGFVFNSVSGRPKSFANVDMVQTVKISDQESGEKPFTEKVHLWTTIRELKEKITKAKGYPVARQRLFFNNNELDNSKTLDFYNLLTKKNVIILRMKPDIDHLNSYIESYGSIHCPKKLKLAIEKIRQAFNSGLYPKLTDDGTSGAYRLRNTLKQNVAIFKPIDEEPFAPNNPRGHQGPFGSQTFRPGVLSGESCIREVAAYLLDHKGFAGVPQTTFVEVVHNSLTYVPFTGLEVTGEEYIEMMSSLIKPVNQEKEEELHHVSAKEMVTKTPESQASTNVNSHQNSSNSQQLTEQDKVAKRVAEQNHIGMKFGSLQSFCENEGPIENFSPDLFHRDEVHKIAIIDLRLLNIDRNEQNILVKHKTNKKTGKKVRTLVPIDHGLCIPDNLAICTFDIAWLSWRQAELAFSPRSLKYIQQLDIMKDIKILEKSFKFRPICLRNVRISTTLLQQGAAAGLNLAQIGQILCRPDEDESQPSLLERIVEKARLIADMMCKMQNKIKDTNLRSIDVYKELTKKKQIMDGDEEEKSGTPNMRAKRNRTNSIIGVPLHNNVNKQSQLKNPFMASLTAAIGVEGDSYKIEAKQRGMSDVDDSNLRQLKDNTTNMIEAQLQKIKSSNAKLVCEHASPKKLCEAEENGRINHFSNEELSPGSDVSEKKPEDGEDEFFECFDDQKDISMLEEQMEHRNQRFFSHSNTDIGHKKPMAGGLRRTASYSNIQIKEEANEDDEDEPTATGKNVISPEKLRLQKLKQLQHHERFTKGTSIMNPSNFKSYFQQGSIRNTAHDEEFFHCFVQYLDEAIQKLKEQAGSPDLAQELDDYDAEADQDLE